MVLMDDVRCYSGQKSRRGRHYQIAEAQNLVFQYLLSIVKTWPARDVLDEFEQLFIDHSDLDSATEPPELLEAICAIAAADQEVALKNTLKRSCYILINNWDISRDHKSVKRLVQLFDNPVLRQSSSRPLQNRLRQWVHSFTLSEDFKELKLFAARYDDPERLHWSQRYAAYLLMSQYADKNNSHEQRQAAKTFSRQLKDRFKLNLALYTAYSEVETVSPQQRFKDPTILGEDSLQQIKRILTYSGPFSYEYLARLFCRRTAGINYKQFKQHLHSYLTDPAVHEGESPLDQRLETRLAELYSAYEDKPLDEALLLRTCNRLISSLTTEDHQNPADIFLWTIAQERPMAIVIALLQLLLISPKSRIHLEARIADLIRYYESYPETECRWIIHFFEMFNVTMMVHAEDIRYSLVDTNAPDAAPQSPESFRIFSQLKHEALPAAEPSDRTSNPFHYDSESFDAARDAFGG